MDNTGIINFLPVRYLDKQDRPFNYTILPFVEGAILNEDKRNHRMNVKINSYINALRQFRFNRKLEDLPDNFVTVKTSGRPRF